MANLLLKDLDRRSSGLDKSYLPSFQAREVLQDFRTAVHGPGAAAAQPRIPLTG